MNSFGIAIRGCPCEWPDKNKYTVTKVWRKENETKGNAAFLKQTHICHPGFSRETHHSDLSVLLPQHHIPKFDSEVSLLVTAKPRVWREVNRRNYVGFLGSHERIPSEPVQQNLRHILLRRASKPVNLRGKTDEAHRMIKCAISAKTQDEPKV